MKIYGLTLEQLQLAAKRAEVRLNNPTQCGSRRTYINTTIRPVGDRWRKVSVFSGRRVYAVDFCGHAAFINEVFKLNPQAKVVSGTATFDGLLDYARKFEDVKMQNIGSRYRPVTAFNACSEESQGKRIDPTRVPELRAVLTEQRELRRAA